MLNPLNAAWGRIRAASKRVKESNTTGEQALGAGTGDSGVLTCHTVVTTAQGVLHVA